LRAMVDKFNDKVKQDEKLRKELEGLEKTIQIEVTDDATYSFRLADQSVKDFGKNELAEPDIRIIADAATLEGLISGEIRPMKALATKKLQVKASLSDMLAIRKFF